MGLKEASPVHVEREIKLKVEALEPVRAMLGAVAATRKGERFETNEIFDNDEGGLFAAGRGLRVRAIESSNGSAGSSATLTVKGPRRFEGQTKAREELEINVSSAAAAGRILETLGFRRVLSFEKRRDSWSLGPCLVELDQLPVLGNFVEIEGPSESAIREAREALGLTAAPALESTYAAMLSERCADNGGGETTVRFDDGQTEGDQGAASDASRKPARSGGKTRMIELALNLEHLRRHMEDARADKDAEDVHQLRVQCGRIRVWLQLADVRLLHDDLRWLRRSAAVLRDIDVLLAGSVPDPFASWLRSQRDQARASLLAALDAPRTRSLLDALSLLPPLAVRKARAGVPPMVARVLRQARCVERKSAPIEQLHRLRRSFRKLRYALEWLDEKPTEIKRMQDALGLLGDLNVAQTQYEAWPERDCCPAYAEEMVRVVKKTRRSVERAWPRARAALRKLV